MGTGRHGNGNHIVPAVRGILKWSRVAALKDISRFIPDDGVQVPNSEVIGGRKEDEIAGFALIEAELDDLDFG